MKIIELHPDKLLSISQQLRLLADRIEIGEFFPISGVTSVVQHNKDQVTIIHLGDNVSRRYLVGVLQEASSILCLENIAGKE